MNLCFLDHSPAAAKSLQSCPTRCDPIAGSPPGSPIPGILQARTLEWVAIAFSNAGKWKVKVKSLLLCLTMSDPMDCSLPGSSVHGIFQARVLEWGAIAFSWPQSSQTPNKHLFISVKHCVFIDPASLVAQRLKHLPAKRETWVRSLGWEDPLEKEMATHSSILAWRIPWKEEPGGLQSKGLQRVGHNWTTSLSYLSKVFISEILVIIAFYYINAIS